jgi:phosphoglycerate dehydrogenase-like enzyme
MREPSGWSKMSAVSTAEDRKTITIVGFGSIGGGVAKFSRIGEQVSVVRAASSRSRR